MMLSIAYPTYKRKNRIIEIFKYYRNFPSSDVGLIISNNDKSTSCIGEYGGIGSGILVDNPYKSRIGDNIINCLETAASINSEYVVILSDEDVINNVADLVSWLKVTEPDCFVLPAVLGSVSHRLPLKHDVDIIFNGTGNLTGIGFKSSIINKNLLNFGLSLANNDYVHMILLAIYLDDGKKVKMPQNSYVLMQEDYHEGKDGYFKNREDWFSLRGRLSQRDVFKLVARDIKSREIKRKLIDSIGLEVFFTSLKIYGFKAFWRDAFFQQELFLATQVTAYALMRPMRPILRRIKIIRIIRDWLRKRQ